MRKQLLIENTIKHVVVLFLLFFLHGQISSYIGSLATDSIGLQTIIILASLLIVAFLFANYTFTFKGSNIKNPFFRALDYINTGICSFGCGALLEISYSAVNTLLSSKFIIMGILMVLFYIALILFDYWDLMRAVKD